MVLQAWRDPRVLRAFWELQVGVTGTRLVFETRSTRLGDQSHTNDARAFAAGGRVIYRGFRLGPFFSGPAMLGSVATHKRCVVRMSYTHERVALSSNK